MHSPSRRLVLPLAVAAVIAGCSTANNPYAPGTDSPQAAYVVTTDFATGGLSVIDLANRQVTPNVASVHSDATLRVYGGLIYVINRFGQDNIQVIDPGNHFATVKQFSTGNGSNPQDIAFLSTTKAYVTRYGSSDLWIVNPSTGIQRGSISLAGFADSDGLPEMAHLAIVGPWLFVACQRLTNFAASNPSVVVVIDTRTDKVSDREPFVPGIQGITLTGRNPFSDFVYDAATQELLISCVGDYGVADGGIERIDAHTPRTLGYAVTESQIGGDVLDIAWNDATHSYAIVSDASFNNRLVGWNPTTGAVIDTVYSPGGPNLPDCEVNALGELYVCDNRVTAPGVWVYRTGADTLLAGPLNTGLPPNQIAFR